MSNSIVEVRVRWADIERLKKGEPVQIISDDQNAKGSIPTGLTVRVFALLDDVCMSGELNPDTISIRNASSVPPMRRPNLALVVSR
jgi:hypothetical protein